MSHLILILEILLSSQLWATSETFKYSSTNYQKISIHNAFGDVHIAPALKNEIVIVANKRKWGSRCLLSIDPDSQVFDIEVSDKAWLVDNECRVDLVVSIPTNLSVDLVAGNGDVDIVGTRGDIDIKVRSGKINVKSDLKKLSAASETGSIHFEGKALNSNLKVGVGDIFLDMKEKVQGRIHATSGTGDVFISLDEKSKVHAKTSTGNGFIKNAFPNSKFRAELDIEVSAGNGDVQIREN